MDLQQINLEPRSSWQKRWVQVLAIVLLISLIFSGILIWQAGRQVNLVGFTGGGGDAEINLPAGFSINVFAQGLQSPRFIQFGPDGALFVAERGADRIIRLPDEDGDGRADSLALFADNLNSPHSLVYQGGAWYVGVPTGIIRLEDSDDDGQADRRETLISDFPTGGHNTRTVIFSNDGRMLVSVGSSCNVCLERDRRRAAIVSYDGPSGREEQIYASGLRNAVGMALQPQSGDLWVTNNGRDFLGDNLPPDTLWRIKEGRDYGWPRCHSSRILDPEFGQEGDCDQIPKPELEIQAHSAPLGLIFYDAQQFPVEYRGDLFIAYHGSWNRSIPTGYKVVHVPFENGQISGPAQDFAWGWLSQDMKQVSGRPVGLAVGPDGALYVSDDSGGKIYRISYQTEPA